MSLDAGWKQVKLEMVLAARSDIWEWYNKGLYPTVYILFLSILNFVLLTHQAWYLDWIISVILYEYHPLPKFSWITELQIRTTN